MKRWMVTAMVVVIGCAAAKTITPDQWAAGAQTATSIGCAFIPPKDRVATMDALRAVNSLYMGGDMTAFRAALENTGAGAFIGQQWFGIVWQALHGVLDTLLTKAQWAQAYLPVAHAAIVGCAQGIGLVLP